MLIRLSSTKLRSWLACTVLALLTHNARSAREETTLTAGWRFILQDSPLAQSSASWKEVSLPHTWNNLDGQDGPTPGHTARPHERGSDYFRGVGWYEYTFDAPKTWQGRRVFLRFEAVSQTAEVYLNGTKMGSHVGAFTGFAVELTPQVMLGAPNIVRVRADNSLSPVIAPLAGDFNVDGGIYRPVHLLVTDPVCISPLVYGGPGIACRQTHVDPSAATVSVTTQIDSAASGTEGIEVGYTVRDASGNTAASVRVPLRGPPQVGPTATSQALTIPRPHLWDGRKDPYLYIVTVTLYRNARPIDEISQTLGLRTVALTPGGFALNGRAYPIRGVNRHQDLRDHGWALLPADDERDINIITELGATAVRLAHYPQGENFYNLCDRAGLLVWNEVPFVNDVPTEKEPVDAPSPTTQAFNANLENVLREMISQRGNHPSVAFWGLYNELRPNASRFALAEVQRLNALAHELDPTRPTVAASDHLGNPTNFVPDHLAYNIYPGWYFGTGALGELAEKIDSYYAESKNQRVALSEYGAGGNPAQHAEGVLQKPDANHGPVHPEEWQALIHERDWAQIVNNPKLWGSFVWAMFDFSSDGRDEGGLHGINDKGLVTQDRKIRKDAYYFYQANWSQIPMVYITSKRAVVRKLATTEIKVYSNCPEVEVKLNGLSLGVVRPDALHIAKWSGVALKPGQNSLQAFGRGPTTVLTDECQWQLIASEAAPPKS